MGLAERRGIKEFQDNIYPDLVKRINEAAGFDVPIDIEWEQLAADNYAHLYNEALPKVYFAPIEEAFRSICADDMGKEALQEALKTVKIQNVEGIYSGHRWAKFEDGVLTLDHEPVSNVDDVKDRTNGLVSVLEGSL